MSAVDFDINAQARSDVGKGASRRLRREGKVPAVLYGAGKDAVSLALDHDEIFHHLEHEAFYSHILSVKVDGKAQKAVLKDVQRHPAKPKIQHVDFQRVSETDTIHMHVPLHFIGEEVAPGVKAGGLISHLMTGVDINCLAKDLPEYIEVDVSALETGDAIHLSHIKLPKGVEIPALAQGPDHDLPVVSIHAPKGGAADEEEAGEAAPAAEGGE
ncbi:MAG: 50S ribosomal protein L25/general stress protein Ctc [Gammaproteobacteria bacterium]|jgi:large subunit ribosomal protein L25|nr:50S ribosomal protein L25/general stress protein Ctc [Gammaproteobacteria bacterium]